MSLNIGVEAYPIFAGPNLISSDTRKYGTFSATSMSSILARVIDGDPYSLWNSSTADDTVTETFVFSFQKRTANVTKTFDLLLLQNINWKNFLVEVSSDGGITYATVPGLDFRAGTADNAAADILVNPATQTGTHIRVSVYTTMVANQTKTWGGIVVALSALQLSKGFLNFKKKKRETVRRLALGNGALSLEYIRRSAADYQLWGATFDCPFASEAELAILEGIKRGGDPFVLILEPYDNPRKTYLCWFDGPWSDAYENPVRSLGYSIPMAVAEVGPQ